MKFVAPSAEELSYLRADPLLWEQELDVRPEVAESIERALGQRAGRVHWRSPHDHLYALELADLGRGRPSMAAVYGMWDRYEPRPPEHEIEADLIDFCLGFAGLSDGLDPAHLSRVLGHAGIKPSWPAGSVLRTPEERFSDLPDFSYQPHYVEIEGLRMAYVTSGDGDPILMLHGEPTWGYLYRKMILPLAQVGRVIVPDLIGFGRSDKPIADNAYSYRSHARWLRRFIEALDLRRIVLVCQDWGGSLGLRALAAMPERFARLVAMNTGLHGGSGVSDGFLRWRRYAVRQKDLDAGAIVKMTLNQRSLTDGEAAAYNAPFPSAAYQTGALVFPRLVPIRPDHPGAYDNRVAIEKLKQLNLPVLLPWGGADPVLGKLEPELRQIFRNVAPPLIVSGAGHFIQEDAGEEVATHIVNWIKTKP
ncbi:MAG TPA: haloalkane dehalogenase [Candidatus Binataceae bacterium]|nr:haloalkane dehalogenase [Candidatus Binataceae bacterium]